MDTSKPMKIDRIIRSRRKTVAIIVESDGSITVRAPQRATLASLQAFVNSKAAWILKKQHQARVRQSSMVPRRFRTGEKFWFLGREIPLQVVERDRPALALDGIFKLARASQSRGVEVFTAWYRRQARAIIAERVNLMATQLGYPPPAFQITAARTRWGSCSGRGRLNFSWRLVMAPLKVIDYVVVHEMTHIRIHNHSVEFWQAVNEAFPTYQEQRQWLKENGLRLDV